jgi:hypothetical protein
MTICPRRPVIASIAPAPHLQRTPERWKQMNAGAA